MHFIGSQPNTTVATFFLRGLCSETSLDQESAQRAALFRTRRDRPARGGRLRGINASQLRGLERLEAILENLLSGAGGRWPIASAFPLGSGTKKPGPGGLHPKGRSACGGRRRAVNLPREEFGFSRRGNSLTMSRCWPNGLGLRPRIAEGNEQAVGSSCGPLLARGKGSPKWLAR